MDREEKVIVTVNVKGVDRVDQLDALIEKFHSSRAGVLNMGLDLMAEKHLESAHV